jgi:hypothetical protein
MSIRSGNCCESRRNVRGGHGIEVGDPPEAGQDGEDIGAVKVRKNAFCAADRSNGRWSGETKLLTRSLLLDVEPDGPTVDGSPFLEDVVHGATRKGNLRLLAHPEKAVVFEFENGNGSLAGADNMAGVQNVSALGLYPVY